MVQQASAQTEMTTPKAPRVLVVDDEPNNLRTIERVFRRRYELRFAASGTEALAILAEADFDLALVDFSMPQMNGLEFLERAREIRPQMGRVIVTGNADRPELEVAVRSGLCAEVIAKPWARSQLEAVVDRFSARAPAKP